MSETLGIDIPGYRLLSRLSAGGMATVYVAEQLKLKSRRVAIKIFHDQNQDHVRDRHKRFEQEAHIARNLQHAHIVQIYDYGITDTFQFLVMEYLAHGDLKKRIRERIEPQQALEFLKQIASALQLLHTAGVVHRDIKPANILFRSPDHVVLADFGIARAIDQSTQLTQAGFVLGTPSYMSPEQINGGQVSARSDIYALGVVFYEMLTGEQPYRGDSVQGVATQHLMAPVPQLPLPVRKLQPLLNKMMAKKPADRIADGAQLLKLLETLDSSRGFAVKPPTFVQRHAKKIAAITALLLASVGITWYGVSKLPAWLDNTAPPDAVVIDEPLPVTEAEKIEKKKTARGELKPQLSPSSKPDIQVVKKFESPKPKSPPASTSANVAATKIERPITTETAANTQQPPANIQSEPTPAVTLATAEPAENAPADAVVEKAAAVQPVAADKTEPAKTPPARKPPPVISFF